LFATSCIGSRASETLDHLPAKATLKLFGTLKLELQRADALWAIANTSGSFCIQEIVKWVLWDVLKSLGLNLHLRVNNELSFFFGLRQDIFILTENGNFVCVRANEECGRQERENNIISGCVIERETVFRY